MLDAVVTDVAIILDVATLNAVFLINVLNIAIAIV
jgi:hypothetical protein